MKTVTVVASLLVLAYPIASQQIRDIWQTTWDRTRLFTNVSPSTAINFGTPGAIGAADITFDDSKTYQTVLYDLSPCVYLVLAKFYLQRIRSSFESVPTASPC
jgi:hypothetical protein